MTDENAYVMNHKNNDIDRDHCGTICIHNVSNVKVIKVIDSMYMTAFNCHRIQIKLSYRCNVQLIINAIMSEGVIVINYSIDTNIGYNYDLTL